MSAREEEWHVKEADSDHCREDGERWPCLVSRLLAERHSTNAALSEALESLAVSRDRVAELEAAAAKVADFCAKRAEYVDNLRNCNPDNGHDYDRWQGHAAARRQLSQLLGLPVGWPVGDAPVQRQQEDPHDSDLHHDYALPHDLPARADLPENLR